MRLPPTHANGWALRCVLADGDALDENRNEAIVVVFMLQFSLVEMQSRVKHAIVHQRVDLGQFSLHSKTKIKN